MLRPQVGKIEDENVLCAAEEWRLMQSAHSPGARRSALASLPSLGRWAETRGFKTIQGKITFFFFFTGFGLDPLRLFPGS